MRTRKTMIAYIAVAVVAMNLLLTSNAFATSQAPDYIFYNSMMVKYPLYLNGNKAIMEFFFAKFPEKRPKNLITSLWRGYVATFAIIQNELYVVDIEAPKWKELNGKYVLRDSSVINEVLGEEDEIKIDWFRGSRTIPHSRKIDWFSGLLAIPHGEVIVYWLHGAIHERHTLIVIENGNYVMEMELNHEQYKKYIRIKNAVDLPPPYFRTNNKYIFEILSDVTMPKELLDYFIRMYDIDKW